jgi:hypothetical protein
MSSNNKSHSFTTDIRDYSLRFVFLNSSLYWRLRDFCFARSNSSSLHSCLNASVAVPCFLSDWDKNIWLLILSFTLSCC